MREREAVKTHIDSPDCWCEPYEHKPRVWVHRVARNGRMELPPEEALREAEMLANESEEVRDGE